MNHFVVTLVTTKTDLQRIRAGLILLRQSMVNLECQDTCDEIDVLLKQVEDGLKRIED